MSTTTINDAAVQKQLRQGRVKKTIFSIIRHLILALLAFIWLVPIAWLLLTSFSTDKGINFTRFVPEGFTLWNYVSIMTEPDSVAQFPRWFMNRSLLRLEVHEPDQLLRRSDHGVRGFFRPGLPDLQGLL